MTTLERIASYLGNGGFFNPECMEHNKVRELILDVREQLRPRPQYSAPVDTRLLALCGGQWRIAVRRRDNLGCSCFWFDDEQIYHIRPTPTHWLPLPPTP